MGCPEIDSETFLRPAIFPFINIYEQISSELISVEISPENFQEISGSVKGGIPRPPHPEIFTKDGKGYFLKRDLQCHIFWGTKMKSHHSLL